MYTQMEYEFKKIYAHWMFVSLQRLHTLVLSPQWCMNEKLHVVLQYMDDYWKQARTHLLIYRVIDEFAAMCRIYKLPYEQFMLGLALQKAEDKWLADIRMIVFDMLAPKPEQCDTTNVFLSTIGRR